MKLYVVGIGSGEPGQMTCRARAALEESRVILGYQGYVDQIREQFPGKEFRATPMTGESLRCRMAVEEALKGGSAAIVSGGDPGVYGMAGLIYQVAQEYDPVEITVVPGVTAACAGAALLGAPLMHDFAVISLSDLLTPWSVIEKRIDLAAGADFVLCFYNPASKKRKDHLKEACGIVLRHRGENTVCGWVRQAGRTGEEKKVLTLRELESFAADMFTTIFVGNSQTRNIGGRMVTPRGYRDV